MSIPSFVDQVKLRVIAGDGGDGCASVRREKFKPLGGPDGGNGGSGGSIILRVDAQVNSLIDYHRQSQIKAPSGEPGRGNSETGADAQDVVLLVPEGTVVHDLDTGEVLADLVGDGTEFVVAVGGKGGLGNEALASAARKAPGFALLGEPGEECQIRLELKVVADVGLVGFPSAGKSSLIAVISKAKPKIADYPFTTLIPNLGVVTADETIFTVADVPGLIEGASDGRGLGHDFLRHIERCRALVHVIDCATYEPGRDPITDLKTIEKELEAHGGLEDRPRLVALNKIDVPDAKEMAEIVTPEIERMGYRVFPISTKTDEGILALKFAMAKLVLEQREMDVEPEPMVIRPEPVRSSRRGSREQEFTIRKIGDGAGGFVWRVHGHKPERWVDQTDFSNEEAVGFLSDRLNRLGIEDELLKLGAQSGDAVAIGRGDPVVFDFAPQIDSGVTMLGRRGQDQRLERQRPSVERRRQLDADYHAVKAAEAAGDDDLAEEIREGQALAEESANKPGEQQPVFWDVDHWQDDWADDE